MRRHPLHRYFFVLWAGIVFFKALHSESSDPGQFPTAVLDNGALRIVVDIPDNEKGRYQGLRFDRSGQIMSARYRDYEFFGPWKALADGETVFRDGVGPSEEFSMYDPLGYDKAGPGEEFVKIAVGVLERVDDDSYQFYEQYPVVKLGDWETRQGDLWVESAQHLAADSGWGYRYLKRVEIHPEFPVMTITRVLENSGEHTIDTDHYAHNFFIPDGRIPDQDVILETAFYVDPPSVLNETVHLKGHRLFFTEPMLPGGHYANLVHMTGEDRILPAGYNFGLRRDERQGMQLQFQGSHPIHRYVFYGTNNSLSLEPFVKIHLQPGETMRWSTVYYFSATQ
ncbi:MAG: hypothetical protein JJU20_04585 [Opitutales bacterium]|nr:hypothetical protein [Opitutales bacterium]